MHMFNLSTAVADKILNIIMLSLKTGCLYKLTAGSTGENTLKSFSMSFDVSQAYIYGVGI